MNKSFVTKACAVAALIAAFVVATTTVASAGMTGGNDCGRACPPPTTVAPTPPTTVAPTPTTVAPTPPPTVPTPPTTVAPNRAGVTPPAPAGEYQAPTPGTPQAEPPVNGGGAPEQNAQEVPQAQEAGDTAAPANVQAPATGENISAPQAPAPETGMSLPGALTTLFVLAVVAAGCAGLIARRRQTNDDHICVSELEEIWATSSPAKIEAPIEA